MPAIGDDETYVNEHSGKRYSVYICQKNFPDGRSGPWLVRFQIELKDDEMSPSTDVSDQGAKTRDEALELGIKHAKSLIDKYN